jgi:FKBP-type peptidyl-prolyl cis-trans isomerase FkpA
MKKFIVYTILVALIFTQYSCEDNSLKTEKKEIRDYLQSEGKLDETVETDEGVFVYISENGTEGPEMPELGYKVNVRYRGWLLATGETFDGGDGATTQFTLDGTSLISGMTVGLQEFKKGDVGEIYIPSALGYGSIQDRPTSSGVNIEAGSILVFDVEMVSFFE